MGMRSAQLFVLAVMLGPQAVWGFGAVAVGVPASVRDDGIAMGIAWNLPTAEAAAAAAHRECTQFTLAPMKTRALCKVVRTFERQCASIASDPAPGGEEWGWAVADTAHAAEERALRSCKTSLLKFCVIAVTGCDGAQSRPD
jgi:hypothetical protein